MTSPTVNNLAMGRIQDDIDRQINDQAIQTSSILQLLGREALLKLRKLMNNSGSEAIQFKAAQDLADRAPDTSKTIRAAIITAPMDSKDAKEIARAMVEAARARQEYSSQVQGDFVRVDLGKPVDLSILDGTANGDRA